MSKENLESKRWWIAVAAVIMQLCLGSVYAWSVFKKPLMDNHNWPEVGVQITFMILMAFTGLSAAFGGGVLDKKGPRFVATIGGVLFGIGTMLAGLADHTGSIVLLYLSFGVLAGLGGGAAYVTPIATLIRWFPDKRGLVTGLAVMGYGGGAFFIGQIAPVMIIKMGVAMTWYVLGAIFLVLTVAAAQLYKNPPKGWLPKGFTPPKTAASAANSFTAPEAQRKIQWWMLWGMLFLNVSAGLGLISQLSPLAQEVLKKTMVETDPAKLAAALAVAGGTILAIASIFNGLGRLFWAWTSDAIGRKAVFMIMFASQAVLYVILPKIGSSVLFTFLRVTSWRATGVGLPRCPPLRPTPSGRRISAGSTASC